MFFQETRVESVKMSSFPFALRLSRIHAISYNSILNKNWTHVTWQFSGNSFIPPSTKIFAVPPETPSISLLINPVQPLYKKLN